MDRRRWKLSEKENEEQEHLLDHAHEVVVFRSGAERRVLEVEKRSPGRRPGRTAGTVAVVLPVVVVVVVVVVRGRVEVH